MKQNFKFIKHGDIDFSDSSQIDANTIYVEKDPVDPNMCAMYTALSSGNDIIRGVERKNLLPQATLDSHIYDKTQVSQVNLLTDGGSFSHTQKVESNLRAPDGSWLGTMQIPNGFAISSYTEYVRVDSFENNNSTYGGDQAPLGSIVKEFMDVIGVDDTTEARRYGRAYAILELTCDPNHINNTWRDLNGIDTAWTWYGRVKETVEISSGYWLYGVSGDTVPYGRWEVDGVSAINTRISNGSWHYVSGISTRGTGMGLYPMPISMSRDSVCRLALPYTTLGRSNPALTADQHKWLRT